MLLEKYEYRYALIPHEEARKIGLGWRKVNRDGQVMINLAELKCLPGIGTIEEKIDAIGGVIMTPESAGYYAKTNTFSRLGDVKEGDAPANSTTTNNEDKQTTQRIDQI